MKSIYLIGSLRNQKVPEIGNYLRSLGFDVFDDWFGAGKIADDSWKSYEKKRGHTYEQALKGYAARHVFSFDLHHLNRSDIGILVLPAGKSGHLELGYLIGQSKPGYVLFNKAANTARWDIMYQFTRGVFFDKNSLGKTLIENHGN